MKICTLEQVIPALRGYKKILITGPQRSGTTIASKIIAKRLSLPWMKEESVDVDNLEKFFEMHFKKKKYVLQAPALCHVCHELPVDAVVFMWRPNSEIEKSASRVNWEFDRYEALKYFYSQSKTPSWNIKKMIWKVFQSRVVRNGFTLSYRSLKTDVLFVEKKRRKKFDVRQTEIVDSSF